MDSKTNSGEHLSQTASPLLTPFLRKSDAESKRRAREIVQKILSRYPDYDKATPLYVIGLIEVVEAFPDDVQEVFVDPVKGISGHCKFLPVIADFVTMGDLHMQVVTRKESELARINDLHARVQARLSAPPAKPLQQPTRYYALNGEEISEGEAMRRVRQHEADIASMKRTDLLTAYVRELGGWEKAIEAGVGSFEDIPKDWKPSA
jgi:hypothetical protein